MTSIATDYVVITPARDEADFIRQTLDSVCNQTIKPKLWVIVNDCSEDSTAAIVAEYAASCPWIKLVNLTGSCQRTPGSGVVNAFYHGYDLVNACGVKYAFLVKLDADLSFNAEYFEELLTRFAQDPKLGIAGGLLQEKWADKWREQEAAPGHVRGATKVYRRECFVQIGGLVRHAGWDGIDQFEAQRLGWRTQTFPELRVSHLRPIGRAIGTLRDVFLGGARSAYFMGYHPLFMLAKSCRDALKKRPYIIGGVIEIVAFAICYLTRAERIDDPVVRTYVRSTQVRRLKLWREAIKELARCRKRPYDGAD